MWMENIYYNIYMDENIAVECVVVLLTTSNSKIEILFFRSIFRNIDLRFIFIFADDFFFFNSK